MTLPRPERAEPPELAALTQLASAQPDLAPAVALERELLEGERRLLKRLGTPWIDVPVDVLSGRLAGGKRLLDFEGIGLDWSEVRLRYRQVVDVLRRHDVVTAVEATRLHATGRTDALPDLVRTWFDAVPGADATRAVGEGLGDVVTLSARPFLARAAEVLRQRVSFDAWRRGTCPVCGALPLFAIVTSLEERQLVCSRCACRWGFERRRCHHCGDRERTHAFAAVEGQYQVIACDGCRRYLKALDAARAGRPFMASVDTVATLPLDQAMAERGFIAALADE